MGKLLQKNSRAVYPSWNTTSKYNQGELLITIENMFSNLHFW